MRLRRALLDEHFRVEGRRTWFETIEERCRPFSRAISTATITAGRTRAAA